MLRQMVRNAPGRGALGFVVALVSCRGSDAVDPTFDVPPSLTATLDVGVDGRASYALVAEFQAGSDTSGNPRRIVNDTIYVDGRALFASSAEGTNVRSYHWTVVLPGAGDRDSLMLRGPEVEGVGAAQLLIPLPRRDGPEDVMLAAGSELTLPLVPPVAGAPITGVARGWRLALRRTCDGSEYFSRFGSGAPFVVQRVAWPLLSQLPRDSLAACFSARYDYATGGVPYPVAVDVTTHIRWWIRIVD